MAREVTGEFIAPPDCPVFTPTVEEYEDPLVYIAKIRPYAEAYGICKIRPPQGWQPPFSVDMVNFKFTPRIQRINELEALTRIKIHFYNKIAKFFEINGKQLHLPTIGSTIVDLYELNKLVIENGGFSAVGKAEKWKNIAKKMNHPEAKANYLAEAYRQVLAPYHQFLDDRKRVQSENRIKKNAGRMSLLSQSVSSDKGAPDPALKDSVAHLFCEACDEGNREDELLLCDKCDERCWHTFCLVPKLDRVPEGEWWCPSCVETEISKPPETFGFDQAKVPYTLASFGRMADKFKIDYFSKSIPDISVDEVEKEYWKIVQTVDTEVEVEYGADLHTLEHGSGFPKEVVDDNVLRNYYVNSGWNLNKLPMLEGSVLRHINSDISGMMVPWMYVGMCFSTFCWHNEDHWSYSINYLHWGEPKTWYGVPGDKAEKFEDAMKETAPDLFRNSPDLLHQLVTLLSPTVLREKGVPLFRCIQYAGEFVVTFPRAYHAGFNQGLNFAEAVNFCPPDWINKGRASVNHYRDEKRMCVFSQDELVCKMAGEANELPMTVALATLEDLIYMRSTEAALRKEVFEKGIKKNERVIFELMSDDHRQCDFCKTTIFLSAIACTCAPNKLVCLTHYDKMCKCSFSKLTLKYRYVLEEMTALLEQVRAKTHPFKEWVHGCRPLLDKLHRSSNCKPTMDELRTCLLQGKVNELKSSKIWEGLSLTLHQCEKFSRAARRILRLDSIYENPFDADGNLLPPDPMSAGKMPLSVCKEFHPHDNKPCKLELRSFVQDVPDNMKTKSTESVLVPLNDFRKLLAILENFPVKIDEYDLLKDMLARAVALTHDTQEIIRTKAFSLEKIEDIIERSRSVYIEIPDFRKVVTVYEWKKWCMDVKNLSQQPGSLMLSQVKKLLEDYDDDNTEADASTCYAELLAMLELQAMNGQRGDSLLQLAPKIPFPELDNWIKDVKQTPLHPTNYDSLRAMHIKCIDWMRQLTVILQGQEQVPLIEDVEPILNELSRSDVDVPHLSNILEGVKGAKEWITFATKVVGPKMRLSLLQAVLPSAKLKEFREDHMKSRKHKSKETVVNECGIPKSFWKNRLPLTEAYNEAVKTEVQEMFAMRIENMAKNLPECICEETGDNARALLVCELCRTVYHEKCVLAAPWNRRSDRAKHEDWFLCFKCQKSERPPWKIIEKTFNQLKECRFRSMEADAFQRFACRVADWKTKAANCLEHYEQIWKYMDIPDYAKEPLQTQMCPAEGQSSSGETGVVSDSSNVAHSDKNAATSCMRSLDFSVPDNTANSVELVGLPDSHIGSLPAANLEEPIFAPSEGIANLNPLESDFIADISIDVLPIQDGFSEANSMPQNDLISDSQEEIRRLWQCLEWLFFEGLLIEASLPEKSEIWELLMQLRPPNLQNGRTVHEDMEEDDDVCEVVHQGESSRSRSDPGMEIGSDEEDCELPGSSSSKSLRSPMKSRMDCDSEIQTGPLAKRARSVNPGPGRPRGTLKPKAKSLRTSSESRTARRSSVGSRNSLPTKSDSDLAKRPEKGTKKSFKSKSNNSVEIQSGHEEDEEERCQIPNGCTLPDDPNYNQDKVEWIQCDVDGCNKWYHNFCLNLEKSAEELEQVKFICPMLMADSDDEIVILSDDSELSEDASSFENYSSSNASSSDSDNSSCRDISYPRENSHTTDLNGIGEIADMNVILPHYPEMFSAFEQEDFYCAVLGRKESDFKVVLRSDLQDGKCRLCKLRNPLKVPCDVFLPKNSIEKEMLRSRSSGNNLRTIETFDFQNYLFYDENRHMLSLEKKFDSCELFLAGEVRESGNASSDFEKVHSVGPILEWRISGKPGTTDPLISVSTERGVYQLLAPNARYAEMIEGLLKKAEFLFLVVTTLRKVPEGYEKSVRPKKPGYSTRTKSQSTPLVAKVFREEFSSSFVGGAASLVNSFDSMGLLTAPESEETEGEARMKVFDVLPLKRVAMLDGEPIKLENGVVAFSSCHISTLGMVRVGDFVSFKVDGSNPRYILKIVRFEKCNSEPTIHGLLFLQPQQTFIRNSIHPKQLFASLECVEMKASDASEVLTVHYRPHDIDWHDEGGAVIPDVNRLGNSDYFWRLTLDLTDGTFYVNEEIGTPSPVVKNCPGRICRSIFQNRISFDEDRQVLHVNGISVRLGDVIFVKGTAYPMQEASTEVTQSQNTRFQKSKMFPESHRKTKHYMGKGHYGAMPSTFRIGRIEKMWTSLDGAISLSVRKLYRAENVFESFSQFPVPNALFWSEEHTNINGNEVVCACDVFCAPDLENAPKLPPELFNHMKFVLVGMVGTDHEVLDLPPDVLKQFPKVPQGIVSPAPLKTMDLFCGIGGLSEGLKKSGIADVLWAVEQNPVVARTFQMNNPNAQMFVMDANDFAAVALRPGTCSQSDITSLRSYPGDILPPKKGTVEMIVGGPPCQGFSGLNRHRQGSAAVFQNSLIATFLGCIDYYRPRFAIMENVKNLAVLNKGRMLQLMLKALVDMGYQCRFAVLQAGRYGLPQSRQRLFVIAAAPGQRLPEWPKSVTPFSTKAGSGNVKKSGRVYAPDVGWIRDNPKDLSAPFKHVTVFEAIGDLPEIENSGRDKMMRYKSSSPQSYFQWLARGKGRQFVSDVVCRTLGNLAQVRISHIPYHPGADWRNLPNIRYVSANLNLGKLRYPYKDDDGKGAVCRCAEGRVCNLDDVQKDTLIPFSMVHTARHNGNWAGCFGRVQKNGFFPTVLTLPDPMRKSGTVLHYEQDRILSIRECARAQGFSDDYGLYGSTDDRYRQIGNAVPPPLALHIGIALGKAVEKSRFWKRESVEDEIPLIMLSSDSEGCPDSDMEVNIELMATGWTSSDACTVLLIHTIPKGAYVDPDEIADLQDAPLSRNTFLIKGAVDVEIPESAAEPHKLLAFCPLSTSENLLKAQLRFPVHLRYHAAVDGSVEALEAKVSFPAPRMLLLCDNMELDRACMRLSIKAPCDARNSSFCTWLGLKYKTNSGIITAMVPVGDVSLWLIVVLGTVIITGCACIYLIIVIHRKDKEFLAVETEKLKAMMREKLE
ncbi:unnamed protein product [Notodromas monacha]|uniref:Cytosine-specific methyltransferase n=1 Tax=Notodromas monacha TaxID=399045 RepID=A0A7R9BTI5_9CRUS|nr:unnamed protein product [Notodromas monacha]CAG0920420.1 unnamed protein product [Notodromas monacha]